MHGLREEPKTRQIVRLLAHGARKLIPEGSSVLNNKSFESVRHVKGIIAK